MLRISSVLIFYLFLIFLIISTISSCSRDIKIITTDKQLLIATEDFCKKTKKEKVGKVLYSCASGTSRDYELSKTKSVLMAKVKLSEKILNTIDSKEVYQIDETTETGVSKNFQSVSNSIVNFNLSGYSILKQKTMKLQDKWITFTLLRLKV